MPSSHLLLEEPIRMASILEPSKAVSFSSYSPSFFLFLFFAVNVFAIWFFFSIYRSIACFFIEPFVLDLLFLNKIYYDLLFMFFFCRVFFLQWQRSLEHWVLNLDLLKLFLAVSKLACLVCFFSLSQILLNCAVFWDRPGFQKLWSFYWRIGERVMYGEWLCILDSLMMFFVVCSGSFWLFLG